MAVLIINLFEMINIEKAMLMASSVTLENREMDMHRAMLNHESSVGEEAESILRIQKAEIKAPL